MKLKVEKKYLIVPIGKHATSKKLCLYDVKGEDRTLVLDVDCKLDFLSPTCNAYIDISGFMGKELEYCSIPQMEFTLEQTNRKDIRDVYREEFRPFIHYTPQIGWINDPNGMIQYHGVYHMFYQYNPVGIEWGNMHWGHAISRDLMHWEEQDVALFPDEMGTMYSGSAIEDIHNVTGLTSGELPPMLLFYTAAGNHGILSEGKKYTQCLAVSTDGGQTFTKYPKNPLIDQMERGNRDPKVVWVEEIERYVMALYLAGDRYGLFDSENLLDWNFFQEISIPNESECPDLMRILLDGEPWWVLIGASDHYVVGQFQKGGFIQKTRPRQLTFSPNRCSYAAQSFSGINDGRVVRMAWHKLYMPSDRVPNQMSIPTEIKLIRSGTDIFLASYPVSEIKTLRVQTERRENFQLSESFSIPLKRAAYDVLLRTDWGNLTVSFFGHTIKINADENCVEFQKIKMPISSTCDSINLRMIIDRCSLELFADGGKFSATFPILCDYNLPELTVSSEKALTVPDFHCSRLQPIWEPRNLE